MPLFSPYLCIVKRLESPTDNAIFHLLYNSLIKRQDETKVECSPDDDDGTLAVVSLPDNKQRGKENGTCGETENGESRLCSFAYR